MKNNRGGNEVSFFEFVYLWLHLQGLELPKHQRRMAKWLESVFISKERRGLLMAFRNSGKSTIVGLFCAWVLFRNSSQRILVLAADYALAKKMVRNVKRIIEQHPLTENLKPSKLDQWAGDQFTVNRALELRDPSMLAKGLGANITGLRADIIICDDVEVPNNCDTATKRKDLRERLSELDYILTPEGMQLYVGTPHNYYTIYQTKPEEQKPETEPYLRDFCTLKLPILDEYGNSAWPERFDNEKITSIRTRSGENKFLSQMLLQPINIADCILNPERLLPYNEEIEICSANGREYLKIGSQKMISSSCWWDPSFGSTSGDNSVIACVFVDEEGYYWLHDLEYIQTDVKNEENAATAQCRKVIAFLKRNYVSTVRVEANGIGKFLPGILKQMLRENRIPTAVLEVYSSTNKAQRIIEAFDVLLAEKALHVRQKIWTTPFIEEMREFSVDGKGHDDALDAVAGCLSSEPIRLPLKIPENGMEKRISWHGAGKQFSAGTGFDVL